MSELLPFLRSDNIPTFTIKSWCLETTLFDGELIAGPFPTFFSEDESASLAAFKANPLKGHWDLMKILRLFFMPESVSAETALEILRKPREGNAIFCFKRSKLTQSILEENQPPSPTPGRGRPSRGRSPSPSAGQRSGSSQPPPKRANMDSALVTGNNLLIFFFSFLFPYGVAKPKIVGKCHQNSTTWGKGKGG